MIWIDFWLVVWNIFCSIYWEFHDPNWRTHSIIFQRARALPPTRFESLKLISIAPNWTIFTGGDDLYLWNWRYLIFRQTQMGWINGPWVKHEFIDLTAEYGVNRELHHQNLIHIHTHKRKAYFFGVGGYCSNVAWFSQQNMELLRECARNWWVFSNNGDTIVKAAILWICTIWLFNIAMENHNF
jgi:hypothetical protein